jgi:hypothetical protein
VKQVLSKRSALYLWEGGGGSERGREMNMVQKCVYTYVNAKMIPVETIPGISRGGKNKGEQGRGWIQVLYI